MCVSVKMNMTIVLLMLYQNTRFSVSKFPARPMFFYSFYVKDISRKLYSLWEKELVEARKAENRSFSHRMYSLRLLSYLKHYFLCVNIGKCQVIYSKILFPIIHWPSKLILLFTYWRVWGKFQGLYKLHKFDFHSLSP